ncbi:MAG: putative signal transduction protein with EAL and GGDEF domain [Lentisphaeria bacterium]|jgi:predicted signal transduction protein with EAL and GGDEF domain
MAWRSKYDLLELIGKTPSLLKSGIHDTCFYEKMWHEISNGMPFRGVFINRKKNGELFFEEKTITPLKAESGQITHYISTGKDVAERMYAQEKLLFMAYHDVLTELPNRALFLDRLDPAIAHAQRKGHQLAVLLIGLDRFKQINDTLGRGAGDTLLKK